MSYTCLPLPRCTIPTTARIANITARAPCPGSNQTQRVRVLAVRWINDYQFVPSSLPRYQVVDVIAAGPHNLPYSVRRQDLTAVQAYVEIPEVAQ